MLLVEYETNLDETELDMRNYGELFVPFPLQFGYRGDRFLWGLLAAYLSQYNDDFGTKPGSFSNHFLKAFWAVTQQEFRAAPQEFSIPALSFGGMSSGMICMEWWRSIGFPLLESRYDAVVLDAKHFE